MLASTATQTAESTKRLRASLLVSDAADREAGELEGPAMAWGSGSSRSFVRGEVEVMAVCLGASSIVEPRRNVEFQEKTGKRRKGIAFALSRRMSRKQTRRVCKLVVSTLVARWMQTPRLKDRIDKKDRSLPAVE